MAGGGGRAWVLRRAEPVRNGAAVIGPPPRRTTTAGSVRRRARDVKGGSPAKVLSRIARPAAVGARPAGSRRGGRGTKGLGRTPRSTPATLASIGARPLAG